MRISKLSETQFNISIRRDAEFTGLKMLTTSDTDFKYLSFIENVNYVNYCKNENAVSCILITEELYKTLDIDKEIGILITKNPKKTFYEIHNYLSKNKFYREDYNSIISPDAKVSTLAYISSHNVRIGAGTIIEPNVTIHENVEIDENVIIRSGTVIGGSGFQYLNIGDEILPVESAGGVKIYNGVEIKNNTCVDKGVFGGDTIIYENVKIDNLVHIAHDDVIHRNTLIAAGAQLGGRVTLGENCWVGVNATISNGLIVGNNSRISLGSVVTRNVESEQTVTGNFAIDHTKFMENLKKIR